MSLMRKRERGNMSEMFQDPFDASGHDIIHIIRGSAMESHKEKLLVHFSFLMDKENNNNDDYE